MQIPFNLKGVEGRVDVTYEANSQPESIGCRPEALGFPMCTATVQYPMRGYDSLMGWVQLVRSDDNASRGEQFEIDPLAPLGDLPHPFCWLGINPTLFDAPSRSPMSDLRWVAQSFLCIPDDVGNGLEAQAILGFSWGFAIEQGQIAFQAPQQLESSAWSEHSSSLGDLYKAWRFVPYERPGVDPQRRRD